MPTRTPPELWQKYAQNPSIRLRNQIILENLGLARKIARQESTKCREPYLDLQQIGYIGLTKAVERFNPSNRVAFSSFAVPYIRGEIQHYLRDKTGAVKLDRRIVENIGRVKRLAAKLEKSGKKLELSQIAEACGIPAEEWREMQDAVRCKVISLDWNPIQLASEEQEEIRELQSRAVEGLGYLPEQIRGAVIGRFVLRLTDSQIAKQEGVSVEQVEVLIGKGLDMLRRDIVGGSDADAC